MDNVGLTAMALLSKMLPDFQELNLVIRVFYGCQFASDILLSISFDASRPQPEL